MTAARQHHDSGYGIVPRNDLDFGLDGDIPRHWFGGDVFKTRFFDAMSLLFPEGERYFIECVRDYRGQVTDPELAEQVRHFIFQEAQHGMQHTRFNNRLAEQGVAVDKILAYNKKILRFFRKHLPKKLTLAHTAAVEHLTAIMAHGFFERQSMFEDADARMRALYMWHGIEEIEHKAVAFDVMTRVAKVNYLVRCFALLWGSVLFPFYTFRIMRHMFDVDGIEHRGRLWLRGLRWLYGPGGLYPPLMKHYFSYYLPGFHPWKKGRMAQFEQWQSVYRDTGDPIAASNAVIGTRPPLKQAA